MGNKLEQMFGGRDKASIPYSTGFAYNMNCDWKFEDAKRNINRILSSLETDLDELDDALWHMDRQYELVSKGIPILSEIEKLQKMTGWVHEVMRRYDCHLTTYFEYRDRISYSDLTSEEKKFMNAPQYRWDKRKERRGCKRD